MLPSQLPITMPKIRNHMIEISGISRANGALIFSMTGLIPMEGSLTQQVYVEKCEEAKFALSWQNPEDVLALELISPDGKIINLSSIPGNARPIYTNRPYVGFQVFDPVPGPWEMIVRPEKLENYEKRGTCDLFVFSQNSRIGGGIIAPGRFFKTGEVITLQFQGYFDRAITGLSVTGFVLRPGAAEPLTIPFSDDEKKDPLAGPPGNGLYSGTLYDTHVPGSYMVRIVVESDGKTPSYVQSHEPGGEKDRSALDPIPVFRREYVITLSVGEEPIKRLEVTPNRGSPGGRLQTTIKGSLTHFKAGETSLDFGDGITVSSLQVVDASTLLATLNIASGVMPGVRSAIATTKGCNETVKLEEAFQIIPRKRVWSEISLIWLLILIIIMLIPPLRLMTTLLRRRSS